MKGLPKATTDQCPLRHMPDSTGLMLGGCKHVDTQAIYIARHSISVRQVLTQVLQGKRGGYYVTADVGTLEGLQQLGAHSKRIPDFVIPDECSWSLLQDLCTKGNTTTHVRDSLRPDIMLIQNINLERQRYIQEEHMTLLNPFMPSNERRKVWIVEGG